MKYQPEIRIFENDLIEYNRTSVDELFEIYIAQNFIYPQKLEWLRPVLSIVKDNWAKAMQLNFPLFWVSTVKRNSSNIVATSSSWQYLNNGMIGQHLTSNHPVGSRLIFLGMLKKIIENQHSGFLDSFQIYYRPQNKYPSKLFESVSEKAGKALSRVIKYNYFEVPFLKQCTTGDFAITEIDNSFDQGFINFISRQRGDLFVGAQELNTHDLKLEELNKKFELSGLKRTRRIFAAISSDDHQIKGVIIINQSSLGLNFSFFENSCELILCKDARLNTLFGAAANLLRKATELAGSSLLNYIPVMVDPCHSQIVENLDGKLTKNYNLFIILKGGYEIWHNHVAELTNNVFQRFINNLYANSFTG